MLRAAVIAGLVAGLAAQAGCTDHPPTIQQDVVGGTPCEPASVSDTTVIERGFLSYAYRLGGREGSTWVSYTLDWAFPPGTQVAIDANMTWPEGPLAPDQLQLRVDPDHWFRPIIVAEGPSPVIGHGMYGVPDEGEIWVRLVPAPATDPGVAVTLQDVDATIVVTQTIVCP